MGMFIECFWGVNFPLLSELVTGQKVTFGPAWYITGNRTIMGRIAFTHGHCAAFSLADIDRKDAGKSHLEAIHSICPGAGSRIRFWGKAAGSIIAFWLVALVVSCDTL